jgi:hypothetical protein
MPAFSLALGLTVFAAFAIGGDVGDGLKSLGVMTGVALLFAFGTRSETLSGLGGPGRDERWAMIDLRASAFAGGVLILALIGAWLYEVANGRDADAYTRLAAVAGVAYLAAIVWLRRRS